MLPSKPTQNSNLIHWKNYIHCTNNECKSAIINYIKHHSNNGASEEINTLQSSTVHTIHQTNILLCAYYISKTGFNNDKLYNCKIQT